MVQQEGDPPHEAHAPPMAQGGAAHGGSGSKRKFSCGVVEGFYGRPWTMEQRKNLFKRMQRWGLNTYMYAPKDDSKHRMFWREMYSVEEADQLMSLIAAAREHDVEFVYAISPGLDMSFSNPKEVVTLKRKLEQVSQFGCRGFALLFDDIDQNMCPADKEVFTSFAYAQVSVTNEVYQHLGEPASFMFCPTEYCGSLCYPNPAQSPYLQTVGEKLLPNIDVLWTGPKVVSKDISLESVEEVSKVLKRRPVIWDNIHANDYDQKRLFLGPFKGRSSELIPRLNGVLTNPNCEFEANFVAVHTLATWYHSNMHGVRKDAVMGSEDSTVSVQIKLENEGSDEELETDILYSPRTALKLALVEWLHDFAAQQPRRQVTGSGPKTSLSNVITVSLPAASMATVSTSIYQQPIMSSSSTTLPASPDSAIDPKPLLGIDEEVEEEGGDLVKGGDDVDDGGGSGGAVDDSAGAKPVVEEPMETAACEKPDCGDAVTASEPRPMDTDLDGAAGGPVATDGGPPGGTVEGPGGTEEGSGGTAPATPPDREMRPIDTEREGVAEGSPAHGVSEGVSEEVGTPDFLRGNIDAVVVEEEEDGRSMQAEAWPMQTDDVIPCGGAGTAAGSGGKSSAVDPVTADDLDLLADLFYLPYEHGPRAAQLLREFHWLKVNSSAVGCSRSVAEPNKEREEEWRARALAFEELCNRVTQMFTRLSSIANRSVLYDLYPYIWDIKGIVSMVKSFVKWLGGHNAAVCRPRGVLPVGGLSLWAWGAPSGGEGVIEVIDRGGREPGFSKSCAGPCVAQAVGGTRRQVDIGLPVGGGVPLRAVPIAQRAGDVQRSNCTVASPRGDGHPSRTDPSRHALTRLASAARCSPFLAKRSSPGLGFREAWRARERFVGRVAARWSPVGLGWRPVRAAGLVGGGGVLAVVRSLPVSPQVPCEEAAGTSSLAQAALPGLWARVQGSDEGCRSQTHSQFLSGDQEPWVFRGGLAGELQRMLPIDGANDLFFQPPPLPPTAKVYTIRPYLPQDEAAAYKVCRETYADGLDGTQLFPDNPDLIGDRLVGSLLSLSPEYCFVLEDEEGVCGYALGSVDAKSFFSRCEVAWLPAMQDKYTRPAATGDDALSLSLEVMLSFHEEARVPPETLVSRFPSLVRVDIHSRVTDPSVAKSMMGCLLSSLKANGSQGAFCEVKASDKGNTEFYTKLGFFEVPMAEGFCKDAVLLGRPI
ncbi:protein O-GlcNAcase-like isoform X2 [Lethenteron reissneri]|uniref:protein O-GlcNAcase-like isoform X2 n=1 Tax=Lethenteron reissneri TaxID=7753 RepID=UPI002AB69892|nr:protein O-GlcNAcase-like isoform X2 [Lethenteron reissneri]